MTTPTDNASLARRLYELSSVNGPLRDRTPWDELAEHQAAGWLHLARLAEDDRAHQRQAHDRALGLALLELARLELSAAAVDTPEAWDGRPWEALEDAERQAFLRRACDRLGLGLTWPLPGLEGLDLEATPELPGPRPGLVVFLEGDSDARVVRRARPTRAPSPDWLVTFMDGGTARWSEVEDVGLPWPPFAAAQDLAELETYRLLDEDLTDDLAAPLATLQAWAKGQGLETPQDVQGELEGDPSLLGLDELAAIGILATAYRADAAMDALNAIAALSGSPSWDYPGQVVRDVVDVMGQGVSVGQDYARGFGDPAVWVRGRLDAAGLSTKLESLARRRYQVQEDQVEATPAALRDAGRALGLHRLEAPQDADAAELRELEDRLDAPAPFTTPTTD